MTAIPWALLGDMVGDALFCSRMDIPSVRPPGPEARTKCSSSPLSGVRMRRLPRSMGRPPRESTSFVIPTMRVLAQARARFGHEGRSQPVRHRAKRLHNADHPANTGDEWSQSSPCFVSIRSQKTKGVTTW